MLNAIFNFVSEGGLDWDFIEMGLLFDYGVLIPKEDKRVCNKYETCIIPIHERLFSLIDFLSTILRLAFLITC